MGSRTAQKRRARRATWIAFGLVAFTALARASEAPSHDLEVQSVVDISSGLETESGQEFTPMDEAQHAFDQAVETLATLSAYTPSASASQHYDPSPSNSVLGTLLGNNYQGPVASAVRILLKLRYQSWVPNLVSRLLGGSGSIGRGGNKRDRQMRERAVKVVDLLQFATELGHEEAIYLYAHVSLFPPLSLPQNTTRALELYARHAHLTGNATSHAQLGFLYATGYKAATPVDQARALLHLTFAAEGGHAGAEMALGYRYLAGIGVNDDCDRAMEWYESAAERAMAKFLSGPNGGRTLPLLPAKLSDLEGGAFGPGSSVASTGFNAHRPVIRAANALAAGETWEDVLEYYLWFADRGQLDFAFKLGKIFYQGSLHAAPGGIASGGEGVSPIPQDFGRARTYFLRIARMLYPKDHPANPTAHKNPAIVNPTTGKATVAAAEQGVVGFAAASAAYLGRMYLRGEGVRRDYELARMWFERGGEIGERECQNGLGIMWRDGLVPGAKADVKKAMAFFTAAANQDLAEAQVNVGKMHYYLGDFTTATQYFETAMRHGSPFEAYYYLAAIQAYQYRSLSTSVNPGLSTSACSLATSFFKFVAERGTWPGGSWEADLMAEAALAWHHPTAGWRGKEDAMLRWWMAAERGVEAAQNNIAFVLDQHRSIWGNTGSPYEPISPTNETSRLALTQWTRSAGQRNVDAIVKVGDYHYHGIGLANEQESDLDRERRLERAAGYYQAAVDTQFSALAMWNLGWMYENGVGVPRDFYLAKRHYDLALETNSEAYLPVKFSLIKLHLRSFWHTLMGGEGGLELWGHDDASYDDGYADEGQQVPPRESLPDGSEDGDVSDKRWYLGKAKDDRNRRQRNQAQYADEDDPVQWARDRRRELEREEEYELGGSAEGFLDGPARNRDGNEEDDLAETMLLVVLCLTVSFLVYLRGRWAERRRQEDDQQRQQQQPAQNGQGQAAPRVPPHPDGGLFDRDDWMVLR